MKALFVLIILFSCSRVRENKDLHPPTQSISGPTLLVLGTVQDAGSPHIGCQKDCCKNLFLSPDPARMVVSLGIVDPENNQRWMIDATPDLPRQLKLLNDFAGTQNTAPAGVVLTHAHIGHYAGLMYLGREGMNSKAVTVYALPRMKNYLENNGPWSQLVELKNITLMEISPEEKIQLSAAVSITPFLVPHRDEFSETAGYLIEGPLKKALFIPDIDKWEKWNKSIVNLIGNVDYAFIDATFYDGEEIQNRSISEIPHPFVIESMSLFSALPVSERNKIYFIHFNHTNPLLNPSGNVRKKVEEQGYHVTKFSSVFPL
jgi:pyrroloquinoline quinone biosynthesis protein B